MFKEPTTNHKTELECDQSETMPEAKNVIDLSGSDDKKNAPT